MRTLSIHQALSELKMLEKRINGAVRANFIGTRLQSITMYNGRPVAAFETELKANLQKIQDLIANRKAIKAAIVLSNANTTVDIGGVTYTVTEAIERKRLIGDEQLLLSELRNQYTRATREVNVANGNLQSGVEKYLATVLGADKTNRKPEDVERFTAEYMKNNTTVLMDPSHLKDIIDKMDEDINNFITNVDYRLSESNATTTITIED